MVLIFTAYDFAFTGSSFNNGLPIYIIILTILIAPFQCFAEELLFRGFLMQTVGSWIRVPIVVIVIQAIIFAYLKGFSRFKGYIITACDGSIFDLPVDRKTRKEWNVKKTTIFKKHNSRARVSCILDVHSKHILTAKIASKRIKETTLAIEHLNNLKQRFNIKKLITIYDRGYTSKELMVTTACMDSKFLIRLKKNTFKNKIRRMNCNDGEIYININKSVLDKITSESIKLQARKMGRLKIRIVKVKLKNGDIEILATNLTSDEFSSEELKELYAKRWEIETGYDRLKNLIRIEDFSGRRRRLIEQDFYANIFLYNLANTIKIDANKKIMRQPRKRKHNYKYVPNFSKIISLIYFYLFDLISDPPVMKQIIVDKIILEVANDPTNVRIDDDERERRELVDSTNSHNSYKKNPM
ncbi:MAG: IS4 family transposase [Methanobrevibacter sp.]|nr:IS4 family transposase [Methanobrevibacter sp.]